MIMIIMVFKIQTDHAIPGRRSDPLLINKRNITCLIVYFAVPANHKLKLKKADG